MRVFKVYSQDISFYSTIRDEYYDEFWEMVCNNDWSADEVTK